MLQVVVTQTTQVTPAVAVVQIEAVAQAVR
jgi:hypothetical protein